MTILKKKLALLFQDHIICRYDASYEENGNDYPYGYVRFTEKKYEDILRNDFSTTNIQSLVTHNFDINDAAKVYNLIEGNRNEHYMGILINYKVPKATIVLKLNTKVMTILMLI